MTYGAGDGLVEVASLCGGKLAIVTGAGAATVLGWPEEIVLAHDGLFETAFSASVLRSDVGYVAL